MGVLSDMVGRVTRSSLGDEAVGASSRQNLRLVARLLEWYLYFREDTMSTPRMAQENSVSITTNAFKYPPTQSLTPPSLRSGVDNPNPHTLTHSPSQP